MAEDTRVKCELGDFWSGTVVRWLQDAGTRRVSNFCPIDVHACYPQLTHQIFSKMPRTMATEPGCAAYGNVTVVALVCPVNFVPR
jgi:hypothetical protein